MLDGCTDKEIGRQTDDALFSSLNHLIVCNEVEVVNRGVVGMVQVPPHHGYRLQHTVL